MFYDHFYPICTKATSLLFYQILKIWSGVVYYIIFVVVLRSFSNLFPMCFVTIRWAIFWGPWISVIFRLYPFFTIFGKKSIMVVFLGYVIQKKDNSLVPRIVHLICAQFCTKNSHFILINEKLWKFNFFAWKMQKKIEI